MIAVGFRLELDISHTYVRQMCHTCPDEIYSQLFGLICVADFDAVEDVMNELPLNYV
jgi:hypothetical protein